MLWGLSVTSQPESFPLAYSDLVPSFPASDLLMAPAWPFWIKAFYSIPLATLEIYALGVQYGGPPLKGPGLLILEDFAQAILLA